MGNKSKDTMEKKNDNKHIDVCPTLLTIIQKSHKLKDF